MSTLRYRTLWPSVYQQATEKDPDRALRNKSVSSKAAVSGAGRFRGPMAAMEGPNRTKAETCCGMMCHNVLKINIALMCLHILILYVYNIVICSLLTHIYIYTHCILIYIYISSCLYIYISLCLYIYWYMIHDICLMGQGVHIFCSPMSVARVTFEARKLRFRFPATTKSGRICQVSNVFTFRNV